jgi:hypothetical protein
MGGTSIGSVIALIVLLGSEFPTTRFYAPDGRSVGSATTYGNQTKFYGPDGRLIGTTSQHFCHSCARGQHGLPSFFTR